jgi:N-acetylglutamate synthase-like GNAT family acetyltransferase
MPLPTPKRFAEGDLSAVHALVHNTIDVCYAGAYPPEAIELFKKYHARETVLGDAAAGHTVVAEIDGVIVATGTLLGTNLRRVFVSPVCQRRGLGRLVAEALEREARSQRLASLDLSASLVSRRFWEARGFTLVRESSLPAPNGKELRYFDMVKDLR